MYNNNNYKYQNDINIPTEIVAKTIYAPTVILPTKNIVVTHNINNIQSNDFYNYENINNYTTNTINTSNIINTSNKKTTKNIITNYQNVNYLDPQFYTNTNNIIYETSNQQKPTVTSQNYYQNYEYQKYTTKEVTRNIDNNIVYQERKTNQQLKTNLNLNNIYNNNQKHKQNIIYTNQTNDINYNDIFSSSNNQKVTNKNVNQNYYYNGNQYISSASNQKVKNYQTKNNNIIYNTKPNPQPINISQDYNANKVNYNNFISYDEPIDTINSRDFDDIFNKTMPNPKKNNDMLNELLGDNKNLYQNVSNFNYFDQPKKKQFELVKSSEIVYVSNKNQNTQPKIQVQNKNNNISNNRKKYSNVEYIENLDNDYILVNGEYIKIKAPKVNNNNNINYQNQYIINQKIDNNKSSYLYKGNIYFDPSKNVQTNNINPVKRIHNQPKPQIKPNNNNNNNSLDNYQLNDFLNNTYPDHTRNIVPKVQNTNIIQNQNINIRTNRFDQEPKYTEINLNINNIQIQQPTTNNNNDILTVEPQKEKKRRPVYKIPSSKKRSISQGKSFAFIHKYYDENFILEEDNEDNVSEHENIKKSIRNINQQEENIKKMESKDVFPEKKESKEQNLDNPEDNDKKDEDENNNNFMRLSHIRFSLGNSAINEDKTNEKKDNNDREEKNDLNENDRNINKSNSKHEEKKIEDDNKENVYKSDIIFNIDLNQKEDNKQKEEKNVEKNNQNNDNNTKEIKNMDYNSSTYNQSAIYGSGLSIIVPKFYEPKSSTVDVSQVNNSLVNKSNINPKSEGDENYSTLKEQEIAQISSSVQNINLDDEVRNSQVIIDNIEPDTQKNTSKNKEEEKKSNDNKEEKDKEKYLSIDDILEIESKK